MKKLALIVLVAGLVGCATEPEAASHSDAIEPEGASRAEAALSSMANDEAVLAALRGVEWEP
ncbi:MAG: hypothetical protein H5U40_15130, partial [Polyangiaceae bacterium]|nr:hypothetical protein [Polyangiaceae bacterium]